MGRATQSRRAFLRDTSKALLAFAGTGPLLRAQQGAGSGTPPNVVFFLIDDLGWTDVGCYGSTFYETPGVNRLARMGMRFTNGYAACTVCSPTRASIMTGKYPARLHLTDWIAGHVRPYAKLKIPDWTKQMGHEQVTIAEALKPRGYRTGFIGKWHLGPEGYWPDTQGFDTNIGGYSRGSPPSYFAPYRIPTMEEGPKGEYLTDRHAADAEKFIDANAGSPFFLYISMYAVHTPLQAKKELIDHYQKKVDADPEYPQNNPTYGGMVHSMDECVQRVLHKLEQLNLLDNTVIMFTGDNGGLIGNPKRPITSNVPLRAGKGSSYEGGVREPFIICWPGVTRPGSVCDEPVISVDFYPTVLEITGATGDPRHNRNIDGVSLVPLLKRQGKLDRDAIYWHYPHYHPGGATPYSAIREGDLTLIEFFEDDHVELYNLRDDIGETTDLAGQQPELVQHLKDKLHAWRERVGAQMPVPNPDYDPQRESQRPGQNKPKKRRTETKHPHFAIVRGAEVAQDTFGYALTTPDEGTALLKTEKPFTKRVILQAKVKTQLTREQGWQNAFLAFSDTGKDDSLVVAGIYIGRLCLSVFEGLSSSADRSESESGTFDREKVMDLKVTVDLEKRLVTAEAEGLSVEHRLRTNLKAVNYVGYHAMRTTSSFSAVAVTGE